MNEFEFRAFVDRVKAANPIEALVSERVELERAGNLRKGRCCFHSEKTPSLVVYPHNESWFCYGECNQGGDVIDFIMQAERLTPWEAVLHLARRGNVPLPELTPEQHARYQERRTVEDILEATTRFYESQRTAEVMEYLHNTRGLTRETIKQRRIGFAPGRGALKKHLLAKGYSLEQCYKAGVLRLKVEGSEGSTSGYPVDYFYNHITIPNIYQGRIGNIFGRAFSEGQEPKYLSLPLEKEHLYNEGACRASDPWLVEGLFDAITMEQYGYQAVATTGTAFKDGYAAKFSRCDVVYVCPDPDKAGTSAGLKWAEALGERARIVSLPAGVDPDEFLMQNGVEAMDALKAASRDLITYLVLRIPPDIGKVELARALEPVLTKLAALPKHVVEAHLTETIKSRFKLTREDIAAYRERVQSYRVDAGKAEAASGADLGGDAVYSADFPGLVDLVEHQGQAAFLVRNPETGKCEVVTRHTHNGHTYMPPPIEQIPFKNILPTGQAVLQAIEAAEGMSTREVDQALYDDLVTYHKVISELPSEEHYYLLAAFDLHTYLCYEQFEYSPILCLHSDPEKGKTRTVKGCLYVAYRGVHVESLREASIIRYAQDLKASLAFDVKDLWRKAEAQGSEDILLLRFEKGAKVARVLFPDRGPFQDTVYYDIFGPTIIATNEAVDRILETRAISITMPETSRPFEQNVTPDMALPLKVRLLAFRARHMTAPLPSIDKPASGRLGDILRPLVQVLQLVRPSHVARFRVLVKHLQSARMVEKAETLDAKTIKAVAESSEHVQSGILAVQVVTNVLNVGRSEKYQYSAGGVGKRLRSVGFEGKRTSDGHAAIVWDDELLERLCVKYGVRAPEKPSEPSEPSESSELTPVQWPGEPAKAARPRTKPEGSDRTEGSEGSTEPYRVDAHAQYHANGNGKNGHTSPVGVAGSVGDAAEGLGDWGIDE